MYSPSMGVALAALALAASGGAYAATTGSSGTIVACVHHSGGGLYVAHKCARHDSHLTWNVAGGCDRRGAAQPRPNAQGKESAPWSLSFALLK
jgi:hypothetical protein